MIVFFCLRLEITGVNDDLFLETIDREFDEMFDDEDDSNGKEQGPLSTCLEGYIQRRERKGK